MGSPILPFTIDPDYLNEWHAWLKEHDAWVSRVENRRVLSELADPMKMMLLAIGEIYTESTKLPRYQSDLGESIQVCFDKYIELRKKIVELFQQQDHDSE
jgi:hypothetical protein